MKEEKGVSKPRRITSKMKAEWALELRDAGQLYCPMIGCFKKFVTVANFQTHYKWCTGKTDLQKCPYCESLIITAQKSVIHHMEAFHPERVEEYKRAFINDDPEMETSSFVVAENDTASLHVEEVSEETIKSSKKRKISSKENDTSNKIIWKHKMKSINEAAIKNIDQFQKCVRFDSIVDKIKSVDEVVHTIEELQKATDIKTTKAKKVKHSVPENVIKSELYFHDPDNFIDEESAESKSERLGTKSVFVLDSDCYKRYHENLTMTRDWSSARKTYTRSRNSDSFSDSMSNAPAINDPSQDAHTISNSSQTNFTEDTNLFKEVDISQNEPSEINDFEDKHQLNESLESKNLILHVEPEDIDCDIVLKTPSKNLNIDLIIHPEEFGQVNQNLVEDISFQENKGFSLTDKKIPALQQVNNAKLSSSYSARPGRKSSSLLPVITYGKQIIETSTVNSLDTNVDFNTLLNNSPHKEIKIEKDSKNYFKENLIRSKPSTLSPQNLKENVPHRKKNRTHKANTSTNLIIPKKCDRYRHSKNQKFVKSKLNVLSLFSCKQHNRSLNKMKNIRNARQKIVTSNISRYEGSKQIVKKSSSKGLHKLKNQKVYISSNKTRNIQLKNNSEMCYSKKTNMYENFPNNNVSSKFKCFSEVSDFLYEHSAVSYNKVISNVILDCEMSLTDYQDINDCNVANIENFKNVLSPVTIESTNSILTSAIIENNQQVINDTSLNKEISNIDQNISGKNICKEIIEEVELISNSNINPSTSGHTNKNAAFTNANLSFENEIVELNTPVLNTSVIVDSVLVTEKLVSDCENTYSVLNNFENKSSLFKGSKNEDKINDAPFNKQGEHEENSTGNFEKASKFHSHCTTTEDKFPNYSLPAANDASILIETNLISSDNPYCLSKTDDIKSKFIDTKQETKSTNLDLNISNAPITAQMNSLSDATECVIGQIVEQNLDPSNSDELRAVVNMPDKIEIDVPGGIIHISEEHIKSPISIMEKDCVDHKEESNIFKIKSTNVLEKSSSIEYSVEENKVKRARGRPKKKFINQSKSDILTNQDPNSVICSQIVSEEVDTKSSKEKIENSLEINMTQKPFSNDICLSPKDFCNLSENDNSISCNAKSSLESVKSVTPIPSTLHHKENNDLDKSVNDIEDCGRNINNSGSISVFSNDKCSQSEMVEQMSIAQTELQNIATSTTLITSKKRGRPRKQFIQKNSNEAEANKKDVNKMIPLDSEPKIGVEFLTTEFNSTSTPSRKSSRIKSKKVSANETNLKYENDTSEDSSKMSKINAVNTEEILDSCNNNSSFGFSQESCFSDAVIYPVNNIDLNTAGVKENIMSLQINSSVVKKQRGRPRKSSLLQPDLNLSLTETTQNETQSLIENSEIYHSTETDSSLGLEKIKKKRGRPRKNLSNCLSVSHESDSPSSNFNDCSKQVDLIKNIEIEQSKEVSETKSQHTILGATDIQEIKNTKCKTNASDSKVYDSKSTMAIVNVDIDKDNLSITQQKRGRGRPGKVSKVNFFHGSLSLKKKKSLSNLNRTTRISQIKRKKRGRPRKKPALDSHIMDDESLYTDNSELLQKRSHTETAQTSRLLDSNFRKSPRKGQPKKCARYADINSAIENCDQIIYDSSNDELEALSELKKRKINKKKFGYSTSSRQALPEEVVEDPDVSISFASNVPKEKITFSLKKGRLLDTKHSKKAKRIIHTKSAHNLQSDKVIKIGDSSIDASLFDMSLDSKSSEVTSNDVALNSDFTKQKEDGIFKCFKPREDLWKALSESEQVQYYPPMIKSLPFKTTHKQSNVELNCFECTSLDAQQKHFAFFTGGPIWSSAWCPTPIDKKALQYVAIATSGNLAEYHSYVANDKSKSLLQLWNLGYLQSFSLEQTPSMQMCMTYNFGNIFDIVWCPSGCWEEPSETTYPDNLSRLGLLAVASSDSFIRIYSIPHPDFTNATNSNFPLYDASPSAVLKPLHSSLGTLTEKSACVAVNWEKTSNCERIAGGYGNGLICIWMLNTSSSLLINNQENTFVPYLVFHSYGTPVTSLSFTPISRKQWLVSSGYEKEVKFWDLNDTSMPIAIVKDGYASNADWAAQCCGAIINNHETVSFRASHFYRELEMESSTAISMDDCNTTSKKTAYSEAMNALAIADRTGTITAKFVHSNHSFYKDPESSFPRRKTHAGKSVIPPLKPFEDNILDPFADYSASVVNTISWNPNCSSRLWLFAGGHSGVARLSCLHDLNLKDCKS